MLEYSLKWYLNLEVSVIKLCFCDVYEAGFDSSQRQARTPLSCEMLNSCTKFNGQWWQTGSA